MGMSLQGVGSRGWVKVRDFDAGIFALGILGRMGVRAGSGMFRRGEWV
jgi:hypothetical protein